MADQTKKLLVEIDLDKSKILSKMNDLEKKLNRSLTQSININITEAEKKIERLNKLIKELNSNINSINVNSNLNPGQISSNTKSSFLSNTAANLIGDKIALSTSRILIGRSNISTNGRNYQSDNRSSIQNISQYNNPNMFKNYIGGSPANMKNIFTGNKPVDNNPSNSRFGDESIVQSFKWDFKQLRQNMRDTFSDIGRMYKISRNYRVNSKINQSTDNTSGEYFDNNRMKKSLGILTFADKRKILKENFHDDGISWKQWKEDRMNRKSGSGVGVSFIEKLRRFAGMDPRIQRSEYKSQREYELGLYGQYQHKKFQIDRFLGKPNTRYSSKGDTDEVIESDIKKWKEERNKSSLRSRDKTKFPDTKLTNIGDDDALKLARDKYTKTKKFTPQRFNIDDITRETTIQRLKMLPSTLKNYFKKNSEKVQLEQTGSLKDKYKDANAGFSTFASTVKGGSGGILSVIGSLGSAISTAIGGPLSMITSLFSVVGTIGKAVFNSISFVVKGTAKIISGVFGAALSGIKYLFYGVTAAAGTFVAALYTINKLLKPAQRKEDTLISWKVLLGGITAAKNRFKELQKITIETPFKLTELDKAAKLMEVFGMYSVRNFEAVGDAASAMQIPIEDAISPLARLKSGIFNARMLAPIGITRDVLKDRGIEFDSKGSMITSGKKAFDTVIQYFEEQFKGMSKEMSTTWTGTLSNISDTWEKIMGNLGEGPLKTIKGILLDIYNGSVKISNMNIKLPWSDKLEKLVLNIRTIIGMGFSAITGEDNGKLLGARATKDKEGTGLLGAVDRIIPTLTGIFDALKIDFATILGNFINNFKPIWNFVKDVMMTSARYAAGLFKELWSNIGPDAQNRISTGIQYGIGKAMSFTVFGKIIGSAMMRDALKDRKEFVAGQPTTDLPSSKESKDKLDLMPMGEITLKDILKGVGETKKVLPEIWKTFVGDLSYSFEFAREKLKILLGRELSLSEANDFKDTFIEGTKNWFRELFKMGPKPSKHGRTGEFEDEKSEKESMLSKSDSFTKFLSESGSSKNSTKKTLKDKNSPGPGSSGIWAALPAKDDISTILSNIIKINEKDVIEQKNAEIIKYIQKLRSKKKDITLNSETVNLIDNTIGLLKKQIKSTKKFDKKQPVRKKETFLPLEDYTSKRDELLSGYKEKLWSVDEGPGGLLDFKAQRRMDKFSGKLGVTITPKKTFDYGDRVRRAYRKSIYDNPTENREKYLNLMGETPHRSMEESRIGSFNTNEMSSNMSANRIGMKSQFETPDKLGKKQIRTLEDIRASVMNNETQNERAARRQDQLTTAMLEFFNISDGMEA